MDINKIVKTIKSGVSGIHIQGQDVLRIDKEIELIANQLHYRVLEWNQGYGWVDFKDKHPIKQECEISLYNDLKTIANDNPDSKLYVIKNIYSALKNDSRAVARLQQELLRIKKCFAGNSAIILVAKESIEYSELSGLIVPFECLPFSLQQVEKYFSRFQKNHSISVSTEIKNSLVSICSGMEEDMVDRVFATLKNTFGTTFTEETIEKALSLKKDLLSQSGLLELIDTKIDFAQIGGLEQFKKWLENKKYIMDDLSGAKDLGITAPKGVLLAGMPGCGKSLCAKAAASLFKVPLLRLDIGSLMGKFVGESEANMKAALNIAEKASPCVLWIDELEKAFSGVNGVGGSAEITTRLFGYFLTWMQEKPEAVFVAATANDITTIPPELLRRGRFDEIFYVDIPSLHERKQIFKVHFEQRSHSTKGLNLEELAQKTDGFSGADIECVINDSLENIFRQQQSKLSQEVLEKHIDLIIPISKVLEEKIENYRKLFSQFQLKPASFSDDDLKNIVELCDSDVSAERKIAASNEFIPPEKLTELIRDNDLNVRMAVLNNPNCPTSVLKSVVDSFATFDFSKPGYWNDNETTKKELNAALKHPNMTGEMLLDLYNRQKIKAEELLPYIDKLSDEKRYFVFQTVKVKLSRSIPFAITRKIRCSVGSIVKKGDILIDIDVQNSDNHSITAPVNGLLSELSVNVGERINSGHVLAKMIVPKKVSEA
jgi:ATP-dependent 26S proteasome regulatory subunit